LSSDVNTCKQVTAEVDQEWVVCCCFAVVQQELGLERVCVLFVIGCSEYIFLSLLVMVQILCKDLLQCVEAVQELEVL